MILCELGQVRKEATAADDSCAGVWLLGLPPNLLLNQLSTKNANALLLLAFIYSMLLHTPD